MRTLLSIGTFVAAVVSFSHLWRGLQAALEGHRLYTPLEGLAWMGLFLGSMGYLAFVIYAADRASGRAMRRIPLFDRWLDRRQVPLPPRGGSGRG
ncbi:MAG: hypothetical protein HY355_00180 [Armatimonadetes bacterium]|nr:hypothetical protein [Armatimonadota bacterium]